MTIIIGLGNFGTEYTNTRHNVGFFMLDAFSKSRNLAWQEKSKFKAYITEYSSGEQKAILVKPTTFYNNSGEAARAIKDFYKVDSTNILAIHDELVLPLGTIRTRTSGSDAGNNGVKSLNQHLGVDYTRIRIGIWQELRNHTPDRDYVLGAFTTLERKKLEKISQHISGLIEDFAKKQELPATTWKLPE